MAELMEDGLSIRLPGSEMWAIPVEVAEGPVFTGQGIMLRFTDEAAGDNRFKVYRATRPIRARR